MPCALAPTLTGCTSTYPPPKLRSCLADTSWTRKACVASIHGYSLADRQALLLGPDGEQVLLPQEVYRILVSVVEALREGKAVAVVPRTQRLTTQEAADFLGVSRPTLVKLLEEGKIPYEQPGRHRRVLFSDVLAYLDHQRQHRRAVLDRMTEDASGEGLYEGRMEDYAQALKKARTRAAEPDAS